MEIPAGRLKQRRCSIIGSFDFLSVIHFDFCVGSVGEAGLAVGGRRASWKSPPASGTGTRTRAWPSEPRTGRTSSHGLVTNLTFRHYLFKLIRRQTNATETPKLFLVSLLLFGGYVLRRRARQSTV